MKEKKQTIYGPNSAYIPLLIEGGTQKLHDNGYRMKWYDRTLIITLAATNRTFRLTDDPKEDQRQTIVYKATGGGKLKFDETYYNLNNVLIPAGQFLPIGKYDFVFNDGFWEMI
jgi:hypothetical protein